VTTVSVTSGNVMVLAVVKLVLRVPVTPELLRETSYIRRLVGSLLSTNATLDVFSNLFVNVSVVFLPTSVSVEVGSDNVPVFTILVIIGSVSVLFVKVSTTALPTRVSVVVGNVSVANPLMIAGVIPGDINTLLKRVSAVVLPTKVSVIVGREITAILLTIYGS
jgi:hypothetical protein